MRPVPITRLNMPSSPWSRATRLVMCWTAIAVKGVLDEGFQIIVSPHTAAMAAFHDQTATGKLKAVIIPMGPRGCHCSRASGRRRCRFARSPPTRRGAPGPDRESRLLRLLRVRKGLQQAPQALGAPAISAVQAIGVSLVVGMLTMQQQKSDDDDTLLGVHGCASAMSVSIVRVSSMSSIVKPRIAAIPAVARPSPIAVQT